MRNVVPVLLFLASVSLAGCGGSGSNTTPPPPPPPNNTATVDFGSSNQTIRGFGGADAWMPAMPSAEVNALFGTGSGEIGLSVLRARIDPSNTTPGSQWATELANAQAAIAAGSNVVVIATPWTPPAAWKSNNNTVQGSLSPANYTNYANYLESFVKYMANGTPPVPLYAISMQNEPDATVTYESCVWTGAQMDAWVAQLPPGLLTAKLMMPESESFTTSLSDPALADPNAVGNIGMIGGHLYGTTPFSYTNAINAGKEVWMTEHYLNPSQTGGQPMITDALQAAKEIHDSLTVGDYNTYVWWWVADWNPGSGTTNTGLVDTNNAPTYFGWAIAQFSRFVRPGYVRSNVTFNPSANVFLSAFTGNSHFVVVAINLSTSSVNQTVVIKNASLASVTPYQTTGTATVSQLSPISVSGNQFTTVLPAQSITTFVQ